jgi:hypothetical protein
VILHYGDLKLTTKLMVGELVLSIIGILFANLIGWIEKRVIRWKKQFEDFKRNGNISILFLISICSVVNNISYQNIE